MSNYLCTEVVGVAGCGGGGGCCCTGTGAGLTPKRCCGGTVIEGRDTIGGAVVGTLSEVVMTTLVGAAGIGFEATTGAIGAAGVDIVGGRVAPPHRFWSKRKTRIYFSITIKMHSSEVKPRKTQRS